LTEISGQFQISRQFQDNFAISGISEQLGPLMYAIRMNRLGKYSKLNVFIIREVTCSGHMTSDS